MFWVNFKFELFYWIKRPLLYIFSLVIILYSIYTFAKGALRLTQNQFINSPAVLYDFLGMTSVFLLLINAIIIGNSIYRDFGCKTDEYIFTYPQSRSDYFWGKYCGSLLIVITLSLLILPGIYLGVKCGPLLNWMPENHYTVNKFSYYAYPYLTLVLPNTIITSSLFYSLIIATRNRKILYSAGIFVFLSYAAINAIVQNSPNPVIATLGDPFGVNYVYTFNRNASLEKLNSAILELNGVFAWNRILWLGTSLIMLIIAFRKFKLRKTYRAKSTESREYKTSSLDVEPKHKTPSLINTFDKSYYLSAFCRIVTNEVSNWGRDIIFLLMFLSYLAYTGFLLFKGHGNYGISDNPISIKLMEIVANDSATAIAVFAIILFVAGEAMHREKILGIADTIDIVPLPNSVLFLSKLSGLILFICTIALLPVLAGLTVQKIKGYSHYDFNGYLGNVILILIPRYLEYLMLAVFFHSIFENRHKGNFFAMVLFMLTLSAPIFLSIDYSPVLYTKVPYHLQSLANGFGNSLSMIVSFNFYWLSIAGILAACSFLLFRRGYLFSLKDRFKAGKKNINRRYSGLLILLITGLTCSAAILIHNINGIHTYHSKKDIEQERANYELCFKKYATLPLPLISNLKMDVELYPTEQESDVVAHATMHNCTDQTISTILFDGRSLTDFEVTVIPVKSDQPGSPSKSLNVKFIVPYKTTFPLTRIYTVNPGLSPGDSIQIMVRSVRSQKGFSNNGVSKDIQNNGTFFGGGLPFIGYDHEMELVNDESRKKFNLGPQEEEPDSISENNIAESLRIAHLVNTNITIGTAQNEYAIAPGTLVKNWRINDRAYFQYTSTGPGIYLPFALISGAYNRSDDSVKLENGRKVNLEIYRLTGRPGNMNRIVEACKDGLSYFSSQFGEYPFDQLRIVETSVYSPPTDVFPGIITFSEKFGLQADTSMLSSYDYLYLTTTFQVAKQWFGLMVPANDGPGGRVVSDGLAKYCALKLLERRIGNINMIPVLQKEVDFFLWGRSPDRSDQHPIMMAKYDNEWINKAGLALFSTQNQVGEQTFNAGIRNFIETYRYKKNPPFADARNLYQSLNQILPDSLKKPFRESWNTVFYVHFDINDAFMVTMNPAEKKYTAILKFTPYKQILTRENSHANDDSQTEYIDIGIYGNDSTNQFGNNTLQQLGFKRQLIHYGKPDSVEFIVNKIPDRIIIDPFSRLPTENPSKNTTTLSVRR